jgi:hypothetical protein
MGRKFRRGGIMVAHSKSNTVLSWNANDVLIGNVDGLNKIFELNFDPIGEVIVRLNGTVIVPGLDKDYTILGKIVTFIKAPKVGNEVVASYFKK